MVEYINKQLAVEELENLRQQYEMYDDCDELASRKCKNAISALPAADVAPVVHGYWVKSMPILGAGDVETRCSECGRICHEENAPYCYCGAKMDE